MNAIQKAVAARHQAIRENEAKGFTLIELLVVVIIIGILAAIAIPVFLTQREAAWKASVESDLKNVALAIETYGVENNGSLLDLSNESDVTELTELDLTLSGENTVGVEFTGNAYVLNGNNPNLEGAWADLEYDSANGGLGGWEAATP